MRFGRFLGLVFFSPSSLRIDPLQGQVEVLNRPCLGLACFHIFIHKCKSLKHLYQVRVKYEGLLE